jgi:dipeptidyl aminopeptidase/acylaminoacyl peptidase
MNRLTPAQLLELTFVADSRLSPAATHAAAVVTTIRKEETEPDFKPASYEQHIELTDLTDGTSRRFTQGPADTSPRFSPDGSKLAFLGKRGDDGKAQLWLMPLDGGEAKRLTSLSSGINEFTWHPDSRRIAFTSCLDFEDTAGKEGRGRVITRLYYKADGSGLRSAPDPVIHLLDTATGSSSELAAGPVAPRGLTFSSDGNTLYFTAAPDMTADDEWLSGLWAVELAAGTVRELLDASHMISRISVAPDGSRLALIAPARKGDLAGPPGLWLYGNGELELLSGEHEASSSAGGDSRYGSYPNDPAWSDDGTLIYLNLNQAGRSLLASFPGSGGGAGPTLLHEGDRVVTGFTHQAGTFLFTAETPERPGELFTLDASGEKRVSSHNDGFLENWQLVPAASRRTLQVPAGEGSGSVELEYWVLSPVKPRSDQALILQVHGGPHTNYGYGFSFEFQLLAALGYTVVFGNPRGSSSYGTDFAKSILGRYGTIDADDVLAISRHAREHHVAPGAPMHITGGSYGGFMTNWLVGQTAEFRSAATQRSICNFLSFYGTADIGYRFLEYETAGNAWDDTELLWSQSPLRHVGNVTTPVLVLHSEEDHRCPIEQAEQWFVALKRIGRAETRFVRFPEENHELSRSGRPDRRIQRLDELINWFAVHA